MQRLNISGEHNQTMIYFWRCLRSLADIRIGLTVVLTYLAARHGPRQPYATYKRPNYIIREAIRSVIPWGWGAAEAASILGVPGTPRPAATRHHGNITGRGHSPRGGAGWRPQGNTLSRDIPVLSYVGQQRLWHSLMFKIVSFISTSKALFLIFFLCRFHVG